MVLLELAAKVTLVAMVTRMTVVEVEVVPAVQDKTLSTPQIPVVLVVLEQTLIQPG
jgi:hypothetical protein